MFWKCSFKRRILEVRIPKELAGGDAQLTADQCVCAVSVFCNPQLPACLQSVHYPRASLQRDALRQ